MQRYVHSIVRSGFVSLVALVGCLPCYGQTFQCKFYKGIAPVGLNENGMALGAVSDPTSYELQKLALLSDDGVSTTFAPPPRTRGSHIFPRFLTNGSAVQFDGWNGNNTFTTIMSLSSPIIAVDLPNITGASRATRRGELVANVYQSGPSGSSYHPQLVRVWTNQQVPLESLGLPISSTVVDMNESQQVLGYRNEGGAERPFVFDVATRRLRYLRPVTSSRSFFPRQITSSGDVVGTSYNWVTNNYDSIYVQIAGRSIDVPVAQGSSIRGLFMNKRGEVVLQDGLDRESLHRWTERTGLETLRLPACADEYTGMTLIDQNMTGDLLFGVLSSEHYGTLLLRRQD